MTWFGKNPVNFYGSGTQALASAISACIKSFRLRSPAIKTPPEIVLPAYGCPSLVSAVLYNNAIPVLADLAENQIGYDLVSLENKISEHTAAIIVVDLFGLPTLTPGLRGLAEKAGCQIIHDCAQAFFSASRQNAIKNELVTLSFGRGKPVSILTGGAVVTAATSTVQVPTTEDSTTTNATALDHLLVLLRTSVYNALVKPHLYGITHYLPIALGSTRYDRLLNLHPISPAALKLLSTNFNHVSTLEQSARKHYRALFHSLTNRGWVDLCEIHDPNHRETLLRYAVLAPSKTARNDLITGSAGTKLGLTAMYNNTLPHIQNIPTIVRNQATPPNSLNFANRLLTLPIHSDVTQSMVQQIAELVEPTI
ncbi:MAG: DegT/DnrJ/EryC1/StrS family aminotransferase [Immundisolibacteraceae bacterium]|nr:DegT/DnrJ/EryC1/StrS family aminotransferase [Immundisolibacteraceae bacterium]